MLRATKIRIYPVASQCDALSRQYGSCRWLWNRALDMKSTAWKERKENLSCYTIKSMLPLWKEEFPWLKDTHSQVLQSVLLNMDLAYKNFFEKRAGYPQFKKKHASRQSIQYPQGVKVDIEESLIYLPKVGWVKAVLHREIIGKVKTVTISTSTTGKNFASILTDDGVEAPALIQHIETVEAIDAGLKDLVITSSGWKSGNPKHLSRATFNLRRKQNSLSRKIEAAKARFEIAKKHSPEPGMRLHDFFGSNIKRNRKLVAKCHERVANARNDWQHKLSHTLVDENQAIIVEDLAVKNMVRNRKLAHAISDAGWSSMAGKLKYKLAGKGGRLVKIGRFYPSSKTCSACGTINETLTLSDRHWICTACETTHDRDINAAINIRKEGILKLKAEGLSVSATCCLSLNVHGVRVSPERKVQAMDGEVGSLCLPA
jgi:putative transposase